MKLDKFFDEKTVIDLSFFNFSNAVTAAYFANRNLEVLRVNKNFKKFFPILKTVNNIPFTSILEQLGVGDEYIKNFKDVFSRDPLSLSFYIHDLIGLVQNLKVVNNDEIRNEVFYGEFSNSKIKLGLLQRQIYIRKIRKDEKTEEVSICRLDEI